MRSKDRLEEFRTLAQRAVYEDTVCAAPQHDDYKDIEEVFREVELVQEWLRQVRADTELMRRLHADTGFHCDTHLQEQFEAAATRSNGAGLKIAGALRQLQARGGRAGRVAGVQAHGARAALAAALDRQYALLAAAGDTRRQLLQRQLQLVNMEISDEERQRLLDTDNVAIFVDNVRAETAEARLALREAELRRDELLRVESALADVHALFAQLGALVAAQQDAIDSIELHAARAGGLVGCGQQQLLKGSVSRRKATRKKLSLLLCLAIGILIVLAVLVVT